MRRSTRMIAALLAGGVAALGCFVTLAPAAQAASVHAVAMSNYAFAPSAITVHVGDSISWTNHDQAPHNIVTTSGPATITSPTLSDGQSWSYTFTTPGTYHYICGVHPDMHATVVVLAAAQASTTKAASTAGATHIATPSHPGTASIHSMPGMTSPHAAISGHAASQAKATAVAAAATTPPSATPEAVLPQAAGVSSARLKPLLLVAGVIAAVTVFCLLALASRPGAPTD